MDRKYVAIGLLLVLAVALVGMPEAIARSGYLSSFNGLYGTANTKLDICDTCHTTKSERNSYGAALEKQLMAGVPVDQALMNIESVDSDGDSYLNIDEINALTFPGDASDYPAPNPTPTPTPPPTGATVTFVVTDLSTGASIEGAKVSLDGAKQGVSTDVNGIAVFTEVASGDHTYKVSKRNYITEEGTFNVMGDTTVNVALSPESGGATESSRKDCMDGVDNDGDGLIDADDPDCSKWY